MQDQTLPNLRIAKVYSEIVNVLLKIYVNKSQVLIWQRENETKRFLNSAVISKVDERVGVFHLRSTSGLWKSGIKGELALYFKGAEQSILFKVKNLIVQKDELLVPIPTEVRLIEKRNQPRMLLDPCNANNTIGIQKIFENGNRKHFGVSIIDISITGAAIVIGRTEAKYFYQGDTVYVIEMANMILKAPIPGKVVYVKPFDQSDSNLKTKSHRIGIQFACYLTSDQIQIFNNQLKNTSL